MKTTSFKNIIKLYEVAAIFFAIIFYSLAYAKNLTHFFNIEFAEILFFKTIYLVIIIYFFSLAVIFFKILIKLKKKDINIIDAFYPFFTLQFLVITFRRVFSFMCVIYFFLHIKHLVLFINYTNFDLKFWEIDKAIHLGIQPNIFLLNLFDNHQTSLILLDWCYFKVFSLLTLTTVIFLLEIKGKKLADSFTLANVCLWGIGGLLYLIFPADGPCYSVFGKYSISQNEQSHVFNFPIDKISEDLHLKFKKQKAYISREFQDILWHERFEFIKNGKEPNMLTGIAAMPSLHVAAAVLISSFLLEINLIAFCIALLYTMLLFTGSIALQWHYAIDAHLGVIISLLMSWFAKKVYHL